MKRATKLEQVVEPGMSEDWTTFSNPVPTFTSIEDPYGPSVSVVPVGVVKVVHGPFSPDVQFVPEPPSGAMPASASTAETGTTSDSVETATHPSPEVPLLEPVPLLLAPLLPVPLLPVPLLPVPLLPMPLLPVPLLPVPLLPPPDPLKPLLPPPDPPKPLLEEAPFPLPWL